MRASKAYIAGLGTTGVLLASSIALLFFVGALVGFDAWPGGNLGERVERVEIRPGEEAIGVDDVLPAADALPAAAGPIAIADAGAPAPAAAPGPVTVGAPPVLGDIETGAGTPAAPAPGAAPATPAEEIGGPRIDPRDPDTAKTVVADTAQQATREIGRVVSRLNPDTGAMIDTVGTGVANQLREVPLPFGEDRR